MAKYMECDVCEVKQGGDDPWIEAFIPAVMLGEIGDDILRVDICSMECLAAIGGDDKYPEVPTKEAPPSLASLYPEPDVIPDDTAAMTAQVYKEVKEAATSGKMKLRPVQSQPQPPQQPQGRYLTEEEREDVTGVQKRW